MAVSTFWFYAFAAGTIASLHMLALILYLINKFKEKTQEATDPDLAH